MPKHSQTLLLLQIESAQRFVRTVRKSTAENLPLFLFRQIVTVVSCSRLGMRLDKGRLAVALLLEQFHQREEEARLPLFLFQREPVVADRRSAPDSKLLLDLVVAASAVEQPEQGVLMIGQACRFLALSDERFKSRAVLRRDMPPHKLLRFVEGAVFRIDDSLFR